MALHGRGAGKAHPRGRPPPAGAAADRFVVLAAVVAEAEVVHRALGRRLHAQRCEQGIGERLRHLHIAGHHRRGRPGVEQAALRHQQLQGLQAAGVEGDGLPHQAAEHVEHRCLGDGQGGIEVVGPLGGGAAEIQPGPARLLIHPDRHRDPAAAIEIEAEAAIAQPGQGPPHRRRRLALAMAGVGEHLRQAVAGDQLLQLVDAQLVGSHLGLQVGQQLVGVAHGPGAGRQALPPGGLIPAARLHEGHVVEQQALLGDRAAEGRHRARADAPHVGMVTAAGHEQHRRRRTASARRKHRRDRRDVGQVGAAVVGVVAEHHIPRGQGRPLTASDRRQQGGDTVAHRTQMHGDVGRVGHQGAAAVEHGAGEVEPLADVHRAGALLQPRTHLFGHRHEAVVVELQQGGIGPGGGRRADGGRDGGRGCDSRECGGSSAHPPPPPLEQQSTSGQQPGLPARLQQAGGGGIADQSRPLQHLAGVELLPLPVGHRQPLAVVPERAGNRLSPRSPAGSRQGGAIEHGALRTVRLVFAGGLQLQQQPLHDQRFCGPLRHVAEAAAVAGVKGALQGRHRLVRLQGAACSAACRSPHGSLPEQLQPPLAAGVAQLQTHTQPGGPISAQAGGALRCQLVAVLAQPGQQVGPEGSGQAALQQQPLPRHADAIGRQHPRQGVEEHALHPQHLGQAAGMLAARPAIAHQQGSAQIMAPFNRDATDRAGHRLDGDRQGTGRRLFGAGGPGSS